MQTLPINEVLADVKNTLLIHNKLILQAPPGAGKTTALPLALLDAPWLKEKQIIMLEPRRLAVRASAARMASLLGENVGESIGYQIKDDSVYSKKTKILIVTEGILTRKLQSDPSLEGVALIIFDEFHERSIHADLSLALSLESQSILREDLKILIMSATLNTSAISKLLDDAPIIESQGRAYPIEHIYLAEHTQVPRKKEIPTFIHRLIHQVLEEQEGNILVFLSGVREIKAIEKLLQASKPNDVIVATLYGNLTKFEQDRAIKAPKERFRKVVLSTNIAQTSLTIEGIKIVIDSGLQNVSIFNPFSGMNRLESQFISQDSATQRAGRAGRVSAGFAYHLWHQSKILISHDIPEILQVDLTPLVLDLALWGNDNINSFSWMDVPPSSAINHAKELLIQLGAVDDKGILTPHGKAMSRFGLHPRLAHMLIRAKTLDLSYEASLLALLVTEKDIYHQSFGSADLRERINILHDVAQNKQIDGRFINISQCKQILKQVKKSANLTSADTKDINTSHLGILLAYAYPDRIAQQRHTKTGSYLLSNGKGAILHPSDELYHARFLVISDLDARNKDASIYKAIELTQADIEEYLPDQISQQEEVNWNATQQRIEVRRITRLGAIVLRETQVNNASNEEVTELLVEELEELGLEVLGWSKEAMALRNRVNFLNHHGIEIEDFSDRYLSENMDEWIAPYLSGITTLKAVQALNLNTILLGLLSYEETQKLNTLAPLKLKVASGSDIAIDYTNPAKPTLSVRLQEMFGTSETPSVLGGKVKLMIHLLSPAHRPMQVTQDLTSFWKNTYDEVKKELRGKYKRHYWPDDPLVAQATARVKKKM
jgi:ATP-dependent helicase HrpB